MADHSENSKPKMASPPVDRLVELDEKSWDEELVALEKKFVELMEENFGEEVKKFVLFDDEEEEEEDLLLWLNFYATEEEFQAFFSVRKEGKKSRLVELIEENIDIFKYDQRNHLNDDCLDYLIYLKSSDNEVLKMNKRAATSQSRVLKDVVDSTGGRDEIPVPGVTSLILSKIASFCKKKHKFDTQLNIISELLKCTMDSYKAFVTSFVKDNQSIFSQLNAAADYLNIPNLMELMSRTMRDMEKGSTIDEISDRYSTLSIARILSPLGLSLRYSS